MIRLDPQLLAFLEKSHLYKFFGYSSSEGFDAETKIVSLIDFQFFLPNCFFGNSKEEQIKYFSKSIKSFLGNYLFDWAEYIKSKDGFDGLVFSKDLLNFFENLDLNEVFHLVVSKKTIAEIHVPINKTSFSFKRFGDILGVGISSFSGGEHKTGTKVIEAMCRSEDPHNNQGIYELIDGVKCTVSLASLGRGEFGQNIFDKIRHALPYISWNLSEEFIESIVECYKTLDHSGTVVGQYCGMSLFVSVFPEDTQGARRDQQEDLILREANVEKTSDASYQFKSWKNLKMSFLLKSSLPDRLDHMDPDFKAHSEQFRLVDAGSVFCSQLCSMVVNDWLNHRLEIDKK